MMTERDAMIFAKLYDEVFFIKKEII